MSANREQTVRVARSMDALRRILDEISSGRSEKPDWVHLQSRCRLDKLTSEERGRTLGQLHNCVKRGFRANNTKIKRRDERSAYWRQITGSGFHDFAETGWRKCYDSPFVESYDYLSDYLEGGLEALDPYRVYTAVLGTHDFSVEDFVATEMCANVRTIVEPMSGTADLSYQSHFQYPDFHYVMIDLDRRARDHVLSLPWLPDTEYDYLLSDVLAEEVWGQAKSLASGESFAYIGKQSHNFFDAKQLYRLLDAATRHVDYLMLETPQVSLVTDCDEVEDLTRPEMEDVGLSVALRDEPGKVPNPLTSRLHFQLEAWDDTGARSLFAYHDWTSWPHPTLVTLAELLDLRALYYHSELEEFVPVQEGTEDSDCTENVTFMLFTRHGV